MLGPITLEQQEERDAIIRANGFWRQADYRSGGVRRFECLSAKGMEQLIALGYADPDERQNDAPSIQQIFEFCKKHPEFTMHGYAVECKRPDCRISIEGVEGMSSLYSQDAERDFLKLFKDADELIFDEDQAYCWFD